MIPKKLHFIWVGDKPLPDFGQKCIQWFKELNPSYEVMMHGEEVLLPEYKEHYDIAPQFCSKSDILRLSALKRYGGWYFDCDFVPLRPMLDIFDKYDIPADFFLTRQTDDRRWDKNKVIANGIIGISQMSPAWAHIDRYLDDALKGKVDRTMFGPRLMTKMARNHKEITTVATKRDFYVWSLGSHRGGLDFFRELASKGWDRDKIVDKFGGEHRVPFAYHMWAGGGNGNMLKKVRKWIDPPSDKKKIVIVANNHAKLDDYCDIINSMDEVIRMNLCIGYGNEQRRMGQKTTVWACINAGEGAAPKFCSPKKYLVPGGRVGDEIERVWFSRPHMWSNNAGKDRSGHIISAQKFREEVKIQYPSKKLWKSLDKELRALQSKFDTPSTGMVSIYMALNQPEWEDHEVYLVGFTHGGWSGHPFAAEKQLTAQYIEEGRLRRLEDYTNV